jgi:multidrug resistance protein MdtO
MNASLRITLASVLTLLVLMTFQLPFASLGLYFVFLVGRDSPAVSIRSSLVSLFILMSTVALELGVVILTDNSPMARVLGVAVVTFLAGLFTVASNLSAIAPVGGFIFCTLIATWELHVPPDTLVRNSLWLIAAVSVAMVCSIAVEYIFGTRHPAEKLQEMRMVRYRALQEMYDLYAQCGRSQANRDALSAATLRVARLAVQGQAGMQQLYNQIVERDLDVGALPVGTRIRITMLAELMDLSTAFASQNPVPDASICEQYLRIARHCEDLQANRPVDPSDLLESLPNSVPTLLDRVEAAFHTILSMPITAGPSDKALVALPSNKNPLLIPGALRRVENIAFALKISLCATLCYIVYQSVDWPGISTSVTTVLITGLSHTGAIKQRLVFRALGSIIGGLILGLGCTTFLFPYMDSITSLVVLVAVVALGCAWCATGRRFNYVGLQIAFAFYIVAFEGFSAPTELAPARDRFIGIMLALVVMIFVFDQLWPVRTVTAMRQAFAAVLRNQAALLRFVETASHKGELARRADAFRDYMGKTIASLRTMSEAVDFEFGVNRAEHLHSAEMIIGASLTAGALFWNQLAFLHHQQDNDFLKEPGLVAMRRILAAHLDTVADSLVLKTPFPVAPVNDFASPALLSNPRYGEYARNSIARFEELQSAIAALRLQA